jgi:hypothetical protein
VGVSNTASVAPRGLSTLPNRAMPEMVNCCGPAWVRTVTWSPTTKPSLSAVALSITTSVGVVGADPEARRSGFSAGSSDQAKPSVGAPRLGLPTALPLLLTYWA